MPPRDIPTIDIVIDDLERVGERMTKVGYNKDVISGFYLAIYEVGMLRRASEKINDEWYNREQCNECSGRGYVPCGYGTSPSSEQCSECNGHGWITKED